MKHTFTAGDFVSNCTQQLFTCDRCGEQLRVDYPADPETCPRCARALRAITDPTASVRLRATPDEVLEWVEGCIAQALLKHDNDYEAHTRAYGSLDRHVDNYHRSNED